MTKRRIILVSVVFFSITVFTVRTLPRTRSSNRTAKPPDTKRLRNMTAEEKKKRREKLRAHRKLYLERLRNMTEAERNREAAKKKRLEQWKLKYERRRKEMRRSERSPQKDKEYQEQMRIEREQEYKEFQERIAEERKTFFHEKCALRPTEEQWKLIKPKLEKIRHLRDLALSTVGLTLTSSSSSGAKTRDSRSRSVPTWKWNKRWKDKAPAELTEAQKIANELIDLLENKNTRTEEFKEKMDALRKSRIKQRELKRQWSNARQELRELLTPRQEAALELLVYRWL